MDCVKQRRLDMLWVRVLAFGDVPLSLSDNEQLRAFIAEAVPGYNFPNHAAATANLNAFWPLALDAMRSTLSDDEACVSVAITTDAWTSRHNHRCALCRRPHGCTSSRRESYLFTCGSQV